MRIISGFVAGLIFGLGLVISGMANPAKVLNFLDVTGIWDPSLIFVMGGASITAVIGYRLLFRRSRPVMADAFDLPVKTHVDRPLLIGASLFGIGWGIGGFCPGPAWVALPLGAPGTLVFMAAMIAGFWLGRLRPLLPRSA
jgi:uncharacterized membrane protein YedE/YeeE